ncbi:hypothetical protein BDU57DRAFT_506857 [Ampelomyces quisqualis]|uniref:C2H2-type domain-containing protein n=1 Tax=Ampelomyces quisqualis TaxID=50730 RepID=A0A6A5Q6V3_AMPQU|nr:hypothetical protein BDU57DRAFT_506857 [Ampelomyces quisqualis]
MAAMSQSNRTFLPDFNLVVQGPQQYAYNDLPQQKNNTVQQPWMQPRSRSVQLNFPSPVASVSSTVAVPIQRRSFDRSGFFQSNTASVQDGSDSDLLGMHMLAPSGHVTRHSYSTIARNYNDESWNAFNLRTSGACDDQISFIQGGGNLTSFRQESGSVGSAAHVSDSGFYSQSVVSHDAGRLDQTAMNCSLSQQVENLNVRATTSETATMRRTHSDQRSQISHVSSRSEKQVQSLRCATCGDVPKCNSDYKKHKLKHEKPFTCDFPQCKRGEQGFTTVNDLDRHRKSVHKIGLLNKSYQCASESCRNKSKIWPRLDNFKQHIERMHKDEDPPELIKRSTITPKESIATPEDLLVAPIDTMVAGMDTSFSSHSNYEPVVESHTRTDDGMTHWPTSLNPADFPLNFHRVTISQSSPIDRVENSSSGDPQNEQRARIQQQRVSTQQNSIGGYAGASKSGLGSAEPRTKQQSQISTAPQTKSEQQPQALKKLSRAISDEKEDSSSTVDLEEAVLRILAGTSDPEDTEPSPTSKQPNKVFISKTEALKAAQAISNLIKQSPGSAHSHHPRKPSQGFTTTNTKVCHLCGYAVARACDLKKHMKRHDKPYGCTYPRCHKRFGAKSDWKRHENSQHFQLEAFRCNQPTWSTGKEPCGEHFLRVDAFAKHLETTHAMHCESSRAEECKRGRIGKNCQGQFWCGFHEQIVALKEKRNKAWDERFDHIAFHFEKEGRGVEEWVCVEENKAKRELLGELDRYVFDEEGEGQGDGERGNAAPPEILGNGSVRWMSAELFARANKRGLDADSLDGPVGKKQKTVKTTYCVSCPGR